MQYHDSANSRRELPPLPPSGPSTPRKFNDNQGTVRQANKLRESSDDYEDDYEDQEIARAVQGNGEDELPDTTMLDSVVLPAIASVRFSCYDDNSGADDVALQLFPRVSTQEARVALSALQRAFTDAERVIPGVTLELVNEIVDSVEHVEDVEDH